MMKWLRKHTKQIMVALVLVAMFSFVGGSALVNILSPKNANPVLFRAFGRDVANKALYSPLRDIELYDTLIVPLDTAGRSRGITLLQALGLPWMLVGHKIEHYHWYMLMHEAQEAGIVATETEVDKFVDVLGQQQILSPLVLESLRRQKAVVMPEIKRALGDYLTVKKNIDRIAGAAVPSELELRHYVRDTEDKVSIRFVALDAQNFVDKDRPVTREEAQAQFEKHKDVDPGSGEAGWGYRLPNRVKVEYVLADFAKIQPHIQLTQEEVTAYWRVNRPKYMTVDYVDDPATTAPTTEPAATQPAKKKIQREKTYSEARPDVERELRTQKAAKLAEQAMRKVANALLKPWYEMKPDPQTGFKPIPSEVQAPDYLKKICEAVSNETGVPLELKETPLLSQEKLATWPELRGAKLAGKGADRLSLSDYAFNVPQFLEKKPNRENVLSLQLFQTPDAPLSEEGMGKFAYDPNTGKFSPTEGATERLVIFRVVEAQASDVPKSLDEVLEDVERDVRLQRAFDEIKPIAEEVCVVAGRLGLDQAIPLFDELRSKRGVRDPISPPPFPRREDLVKKKDRPDKAMELLLAGKSTLLPPDIRGAGDSAEFVDACFEMAQPDWKAPALQPPATTQTAAATTRPAVSPEPLVRVLPLPKSHKWFVIQLLRTDPVDTSEYLTQLKESAYQAIMSERSRALVSNWLLPENVEKRCNFEPVRGEGMGRGSEGIQPIMPVAPVAPDMGY